MMIAKSLSMVDQISSKFQQSLTLISWMLNHSNCPSVLPDNLTLALLGKSSEFQAFDTQCAAVSAMRGVTIVPEQKPPSPNQPKEAEVNMTFERLLDLDKACKDNVDPNTTLAAFVFLSLNYISVNIALSSLFCI